MRLVPTLVLAAFVAVPAGTAAWAQSEAPTSNREEARTEAIKLFQRSRTAYQRGRFKEAAELLRNAYGLDPAPTLLYNLARALESDGDFEGAAAAYREYLTADPNAKDRAAIEQRIQNLDAQIREREELRRRLEEEKAKKIAAAPETGATSGVQTSPPRSGTNPIPWVFAGVGAAGVGAGAVLGILAQSKHNQAQDEGGQTAAASLDDEARGLARGANIAYIAGGALAAAGVVWGIIDLVTSGSGGADPELDGDDLTLSPTLHPRGIGLVGRF